MRTNMLIARILRELETGGAGGNGAPAAEAYAKAVQAANARLESVCAALDAKNIGEAIRQMAEDPPLLEEISMLDLRQTEDWVNLCDMMDWTRPPTIDRTMTDRVAEVADTGEAIAPYLSMYKKAIRVDNVRQAVKSLRRLVELDKSQDWSKNLAQSERRLQAKIVAEFAAATADEDRDRLVHELFDGVWSGAVNEADAAEMRRYRDRRAAESRDREGAENLALLKKCRDEKWDRKLALRLVPAVDALVAQGWKVPSDGLSVVEDCRRRAAQEVEREETERHWRDLNDALHVAVEKADETAIRDLLGSPEFRDRDPENGLYDKACDVLEHAEILRRRKRLQIVFFSFLAAVGVVGVSAWWLKQKMASDLSREALSVLEGEIAKVGKTPRRALDSSERVLARIRNELPETYAQPGTAALEAKLQGLRKEFEARTNEIGRTLAEIEAVRDRGWRDGETSVTNGLGRVRKLLRDDDLDFYKRMLLLQSGWTDHTVAVARSAKANAETTLEGLVVAMREIAARLKSELMRSGLSQRVKILQDSLESWRTSHAKDSPEAAARFEKEVQIFNEAVEAQKLYREALADLTKAENAEALLKARAQLVDYYGHYPEVKRLGNFPVTDEDIRDVLSAEPRVLSSFRGSFVRRVSDGEFNSFLTDGVAALENNPKYYSMYGVVLSDNPRTVYAVSVGRPTVKKASYENFYEYSSENGIVGFRKEAITDSLKARSQPQFFTLPSTDEIRKVVDIANRPSLTPDRFESELLQLVDAHCAAVMRDVRAGKNALPGSFPAKGWVSPYRRVQLVAMYLRWLKDELKMMPADKGLDRIFNRMNDLGDVVGGTPAGNDLCWVCIWDGNVQERMRRCQGELAELADYGERYRKAKACQTALADVLSWRVLYAGRVDFNPLNAGWEKDPEAIRVIAPGVANDHPLYVLRRIAGSVRLVRAFERGKSSPWRMCSAVAQSGTGYVLGEPLFQVMSRGAFVDVQHALSEIAKKTERDEIEIPLYGKGGR